MHEINATIAPLPPAARWQTWLAGRPWKENACWAVFLAVYGLVVYLGVNRIVARLPNVGTLCFSWERHIPLVPIFIIPYWSTDLLYFMGPLLCTSRVEVRTLAKRMILAVTTAAAFFLLFPLQLAYPRPHVSGVLGTLFQLLYLCDRPVNMAPSLHITEVALLWGVYSRHTAGWARRAIQLWMIAIAASTLLVWQHHVIDVVTGYALAVICIQLFPDADSKSRG
jgi:membrane-associated phospholipid phosphatase